MSGGSYGYLCHKSADDLFANPTELEHMRDRRTAMSDLDRIRQWREERKIDRRGSLADRKRDRIMELTADNERLRGIVSELCTLRVAGAVDASGLLALRKRAKELVGDE